MKLINVVIQDGENQYDEWYTIKDNEIPKKEDYADGFLRKVKNILVYDITEEEYKVLAEFGVI